ncbi:MAG: amidohydrolase [Candidatus Eisenbacteria bacterium]
MRAFLGGRIFGAGPEATAVLVGDDGRIAAVGADEEIGSRVTKDTETVGLAGGLVVPGFQDAHVHLCQLGRALARPDLGEAKDLGAALETAARWRREKARGPLLLDGFDETRWPEKRTPHRNELDRIEPDRPLILRRVCCHVAIANTAALARIPESAPNVDRATGRLEEDAAFRLETDYFPPGEEEDREAIRRAEAHAFSLGVTTVHEIDVPRVVPAYRALEARGELRIRVFFFVCSRPGEAALLRDPEERGLFRVAGVKTFLDGSLGGATAAMADPYEGGGRGTLLLGVPEIAKILREAEGLRIPSMMHAIGDRAIGAFLSAHEEVRSAGAMPLPHRVEHAEALDDAGADRLAALGVRLSMQPNFPLRWGGSGGMYEARLGARRAAGLNRIGSWRRRGLPLAFGSDGMPFDPFYGIRGAVEHPVESERISWEEALRLYTGSAESFVERGGEAGAIAPGKRADFAVFDGAAGLTETLCKENLRATVVGGEVVHER